MSHKKVNKKQSINLKYQSKHKNNNHFLKNSLILKLRSLNKKYRNSKRKIKKSKVYRRNANSSCKEWQEKLRILKAKRNRIFLSWQSGRKTSCLILSKKESSWLKRDLKSQRWESNLIKRWKYRQPMNLISSYRR